MVVFALFSEALEVCGEVFQSIAVSPDSLGTQNGHNMLDTGLRSQEFKGEEKRMCVARGRGKCVGRELGHSLMHRTSAQQVRMLSYSRHFATGASLLEGRPPSGDHQITKGLTACEMLHLLG